VPVVGNLAFQVGVQTDQTWNVHQETVLSVPSKWLSSNGLRQFLLTDLFMFSIRFMSVFFYYKYMLWVT
jgi:hypothetical protein